MPRVPRSNVLLEGGDLDGFEVEVPCYLGLFPPFIAVPEPKPKARGLWHRLKLCFHRVERTHPYAMVVSERSERGYPLFALGPEAPEGQGRYLVYRADERWESRRGGHERVGYPRPARALMLHQVRSRPTKRSRPSALAGRLGV